MRQPKQAHDITRVWFALISPSCAVCHVLCWELCVGAVPHCVVQCCLGRWRGAVLRGVMHSCCIHDIVGCFIQQCCCSSCVPLGMQCVGEICMHAWLEDRRLSSLRNGIHSPIFRPPPTALGIQCHRPARNRHARMLALGDFPHIRYHLSICCVVFCAAALPLLCRLARAPPWGRAWADLPTMACPFSAGGYDGRFYEALRAPRDVHALYRGSTAHPQARLAVQPNCRPQPSVPWIFVFVWQCWL